MARRQRQMCIRDRFLVGFVPGYGISFVMKMMGWLRVPDAVQKAGIDSAELGLRATAQ